MEIPPFEKIGKIVSNLTSAITDKLKGLKSARNHKVTRTPVTEATDKTRDAPKNKGALAKDGAFLKKAGGLIGKGALQGIKITGEIAETAFPADPYGESHAKETPEMIVEDFELEEFNMPLEPTAEKRDTNKELIDTAYRGLTRIVEKEKGSEEYRSKIKSALEQISKTNNDNEKISILKENFPKLYEKLKNDLS
ncbi:MAG: hypothetical protein K940chlam3_00198 [Chlamydiae bacterium]|nr:hypothetical protein [Chlamydiota bacterium]